MQVEILYQGAFALAKMALEQGESAKAESGAMVAMSPTVDVESRLDGGVFGALKRKFLTGETFFFQTLRATRGPGEVLIAPTVPGEILSLELDGAHSYCLQKDGFLASSVGVDVQTKTQSLAKGFFSGEGFFVLQATGTGSLLVNSFGSIHRLLLSPAQEYIVDNSHLVAWSSSTEYEIRKASSGWFSSVASGEGLVCHFRGPGEVFIQTRNPGAFGSWIRQFIPTSG